LTQIIGRQWVESKDCSTKIAQEKFAQKKG